MNRSNLTLRKLAVAATTTLTGVHFVSLFSIAPQPREPDERGTHGTESPSALPSGMDRRTALPQDIGSPLRETAHRGHLRPLAQ